MKNTATGQIELKPQKKVSHAGNTYVFWTMANRTKRFRCRAFKDNVAKALKLKQGDEIIVEGKFEETEGDPDMVDVLVWSFGYANEKKQAKQRKKHNDNSYVTEEEKERMAAKGIVYARVDKGVCDWCRKEHAVQIGEHWVSQIYFILEMLGAEKVNLILKQEGVGISENLKHWTHVRKDLLGIAMTDWNNGVRPK